MNCQRCGWCCYGLRAVLPDGTLKREHAFCKFLEWDNALDSKCLLRPHIAQATWANTTCGGFDTEGYFQQDYSLRHRLPCFIGLYIRGLGGLKVFAQTSDLPAPKLIKTITTLLEAIT